MTVLLTQGGNNKIVEKYTRDSVTHTVFNEKIINNSTSEKLQLWTEPMLIVFGKL